MVLDRVCSKHFCHSLERSLGKRISRIYSKTKRKLTIICLLLFHLPCGTLLYFYHHSFVFQNNNQEENHSLYLVRECTSFIGLNWTIFCIGNVKHIPRFLLVQCFCGGIITVALYWSNFQMDKQKSMF